MESIGQSHAVAPLASFGHGVGEGYAGVTLLAAVDIPRLVTLAFGPILVLISLRLGWKLWRQITKHQR